MKKIFIAAISLSLAACAPKSLYQWGGYDDMLYRGYKDPEKMEAMRISLEAHVQKLQQSGQKVPPGMNSEIATLFMQAGNKPQAIIYYTAEKNAWPESRGLMEALIKNLDKTPKEKTQ